jgi:hypothetical protein
MNQEYFMRLALAAAKPGDVPYGAVIVKDGAVLSAITHPCILKEVVDRHTLGHIRPLCSMGHHNNLHDRTRTVARVKALNTDS